MKNFIIKVDMTEELQAAMLREVDISSVRSLYEEGKSRNLSAGILGVDALVIEEYDKRKKRIMPSAKECMEKGASLYVSSRFAALPRVAPMPNGKERTIRDTVGPQTKKVKNDKGETEYRQEKEVSPDPNESKETEHAFVDSLSDEGMRRSVRYLEVSVPGYIMGRLEIIAANGTAEDVTQAANNLKAKIDELVSQLVD